MTNRPSSLRSFLGALSAVLLPFGLGTGGAASARAEPERFVVYYGNDAAAADFAPYSRAVLDSDHHPPLGPLKARGIELFGYLSLGEADQARAYYPAAAAAGLLLGANPDWPGARYVDLRQPAWSAEILDRLIPALLDDGFEGLFLDKLDDAAFLEHADPVRNHGMVAAAATLVRAIHARYPAVPLMLNRAYDVGALVATELDSVLAESLLTTHDFKTRRYLIRTQNDLNWGMGKLAELRRLNPKLRLYTLDYWEPADRTGIARLYEQERRAGFIPYVATIDLQRIVAEPAKGGKPSPR